MKAIVSKLATMMLLGLLLGQVGAQGIPDWFPITFTADLTADRAQIRGEIATASFIAILTGNRLVVTGNLRDVGVLTRGVGIFQAPPGETGPQVELDALTGSHVVNGFMVPVVGTEDMLSAVFELTDEQVMELKAGLWYVQVFPQRSPVGTLKGHLTSQVDYSQIEPDPTTQDMTAEDMVGIWMHPGNRAPFGVWESRQGSVNPEAMVDDAYQIFPDGGIWRYVDTLSKTNDDPETRIYVGGPWEFRDNIATLTSVADLAFEVACSGDLVFYEELHEDGSRSSLLLQAPEGCYRDDAGTWFHWGQKVNP